MIRTLLRSTIIGALIILFSFSQSAFGQSGQRVTDFVDQQKEELLEKYRKSKLSKKGATQLQNQHSFITLEQQQAFNLNPNTRPEWNFRLFGSGNAAGDFDGDGVPEIIYSDIARNELTSGLSDNVGKTGIYEGSSSTFAPDELIYERMFAVGDINGDGFDDRLKYSVDASASPELILGNSNNNVSPSGFTLGNIYSSTEDRVLGFYDLDNDGNDDIVMFNSFGNSIWIYWGDATNPAQDFTQLFFVNDVNRPQTMVVGNLDSDANAEVVALRGFEPSTELVRIDFADDRTTTEEVLTTEPFDGFMDQKDLTIANLDGSGLSEILIRDGLAFSPAVYLVKEDPSNAGSYSSVPELFFTGPVYSIGDVDNDGRDDLFVGDASNNNAPYIAFGPADLTNGLSLDFDLAANTPGTNWRWNYDYQPQTTNGDLNGDGIDDFVIGHRDFATGETGRRYVFGNTDRTAITSSFAMEAEETFFSGINTIQDIGDVNDDGTDDFAVIQSAPEQVGIFFGGQTISNTPDLAIPNALLTRQLTVTGGDFNGDGVSDFFVDYNTGAQIDIYFGGTNVDATADVTIDPRQTVDENTYSSPGFYLNENIGDINNDGADDILANAIFAFDTTSAATGYLNHSYVFLGGSSISTTADYTIDGRSVLSNESIRWGWSDSGLGDVNGDGIDDFAIGANNYLENNDQGVVLVYFGSTSPNFSQPDLMLKEGAGSFGNSISDGGDLNGDGYNDIVVSKFSRFDSIELVFIYNGGPSIDEVADLELTIPAESSVGLDSDDDGLSDFGIGVVEIIPDFDGNGTDELIVSSQFGTNALLFSGTSSSFSATHLFKAPNSLTSMSPAPFYETVGVGDFNGDGKLNILFNQEFDNNDAYQSSRFYRYDLERPLVLTGVTDVPNDQGGWVELRVDGPLLESQSVNNWSAWRNTDEGWVNVANVPFYQNAATYVEANVPRTATSGTAPADDQIFEFKVLAHDSDGGILAGSQPVSGHALDNIVPAPAKSLNATFANGTVDLDWDPSTENDFAEYLVVEEVNGDLDLDNPLTATRNSDYSFSFPSDQDLIKVAVLVKDEHGNVSEKGQMVSIASDGSTTSIAVNKTVTVSAADGGVFTDEATGANVTIPAGALDSDIELEMGSYSSVPSGANVSGLMIHLGPNGTTFSSPVEITVSYDPNNLPANVATEADLKIVRYNSSDGTWTELPTTVDQAANTATAQTSSFSGFAAGRVTGSVSNELDETEIPAEFVLKQNYPNPFNPSTNIEYGIPQTANVSITVYNSLGQQVATIAQGRQSAGFHTVSFDASSLSSGVYIYRIQAGDFIETKKMMLIK